MRKELQNLILAENQQIDCDRILLRKVEITDAKDLFEYASDKETVEFMSFPRHETLEATKESIANLFFTERLTQYAIELKENGKMIGTIGMHYFDENSCELGWIIHKDFWGNGYMPEAANRLLTLLFEQLDLNQVHAIHDVENKKSGRVMEKIGMTKVGTIPSHSYRPSVDEWRAIDYYALTKEDYLHNKKNMLK